MRNRKQNSPRNNLWSTARDYARGRWLLKNGDSETMKSSSTTSNSRLKVSPEMSQSQINQTRLKKKLATWLCRDDLFLSSYVKRYMFPPLHPWVIPHLVNTAASARIPVQGMSLSCSDLSDDAPSPTNHNRHFCGLPYPCLLLQPATFDFVYFAPATGTSS